MELSLRRCTGNDVDVLMEISKSTFIAAFEQHNDPEDFKNYLKEAFAKEKLQSELENKNSAFYFVYLGEVLVGYFKTNRGEAQTEVKDSQSLELERIYVVPSYQGMKIGGWMIEKVIQLASDENMKYVWLGVWEHNPRAIKFYQKLGFQKFGTHPYYIGKDEQTDWLLRLRV